jgi:hypothetical protein
MISVLIPTYNYNVFPLASQIEKQALKYNIIFELICVDDGSLSTINIENTKINTLKNCKFIEATHNIGLSNNRNLLAKLSKYNNLLFIDGDSILPDEDFLNRYINANEDDIDVIYGGRKHPKTNDKLRKLRWKYGVYREDTSLEERKKQPFKRTLFNNTLIKKNTFNKIGFEESITEYGHEDSLFAFHLSKLNAKTKHIENPVLHGDIDFNEIFFNKMHKSIQNLKYINDNALIDTNFITFLKVYNIIKQLKLNYPLAYFYLSFKSFFSYQLKSKHASIIVFDVFRLSYFCHINLKK